MPCAPGSGGSGRCAGCRRRGRPGARPRALAGTAVARLHDIVGDGLAAARSSAPPSSCGPRTSGRSGFRSGLARVRAHRASGRCRCARCRGRRTAWTGRRGRDRILAATMTPEVSLSSRWTMPGRATPPMPDRLSPQWCSRALTRVPIWRTGCGMGGHAGGLVDDDQVGVLEQDGQRDCLGQRGSRGDRRHARSHRSRPRPWTSRWSATRRRRLTAPSASRAWIRARDSSETTSASALSRRWPGTVTSTVRSSPSDASSGSASSWMSFRTQPSVRGRRPGPVRPWRSAWPSGRWTAGLILDACPRSRTPGSAAMQTLRIASLAGFR